MDGWRDGQMDGRMDGRMDGWIVHAFSEQNISDLTVSKIHFL